MNIYIVSEISNHGDVIERIRQVVFGRWKAEATIVDVASKSRLTVTTFSNKLSDSDIVVVDTACDYDIDGLLAADIKVYKDSLRGYAGIVKATLIDEDEHPGLNQHLFSRLSHNAGYGYYYFPYTFLARSNGYGDINELGFRLPNNWMILKNRDKNTKVVLMFGSSSTFDVYVPIGERISDYLEIELNNRSDNGQYVVLNFGMSGYLILNEIMTFTLFAHALNPDIVISHGGYTDLLHGQISDSLLLEKYSIMYAKFYEKWGTIVHDFTGSLYEQRVQEFFPRNTPMTIVEAYIDRLFQFKELVESCYGAKFIFGLQPLISHKLQLSASEKKSAKEFATDKKYARLEGNLSSIFNILISKLQTQKFPYIDLTKKAKTLSCDDVHFVDTVHTTAILNKLIASHYADTILKRDSI